MHLSDIILEFKESEQPILNRLLKDPDAAQDVTIAFSESFPSR